MQTELKTKQPKTITVKILSDSDAKWFGSPALLVVSPWGWFPVETLCDVNEKGKFVAKSFAKGLNISGNLGSGAVGITKESVGACVDALKASGFSIEQLTEGR